MLRTIETGWSEELAVFLSSRGQCLMKAGRTIEAATSYAEALRLAPAVQGYRLLLQDPIKAGVRSGIDRPTIQFSRNTIYLTKGLAMKNLVANLVRLLALSLLLLAVQPASAFYDPGTQRWLNRDPMGEVGFRILRMADPDAKYPPLDSKHLSLSPREITNEEDILAPNAYLCFQNSPTYRIDAFGLVAKIVIVEIFEHGYMDDAGGKCLYICYAKRPNTSKPKDQKGFGKCMGLARDWWNQTVQQAGFGPPNIPQLRRVCKQVQKCFDKYW